MSVHDLPGQAEAVMEATRPQLGPPLECEVRDGRLCRWTAG